MIFSRSEAERIANGPWWLAPAPGKGLARTIVALYDRLDPELWDITTTEQARLVLSEGIIQKGRAENAALRSCVTQLREGKIPSEGYWRVVDHHGRIMCHPTDEPMTEAEQEVMDQ